MLFLATPCDMWDPSFLISDLTHVLCSGSRVLTTRPPGKSQCCLTFCQFYCIERIPGKSPSRTEASQGMLSYHLAFCLWLPERPFKRFKPVGLELCTKWYSV